VGGDNTKPVMDVLVFLSDDNLHDYHAVQQSISMAIQFLKEKKEMLLFQLFMSSLMDALHSTYPVVLLLTSALENLILVSNETGVILVRVMVKVQLTQLEE
jgi:hypothetical protein